MTYFQGFMIPVPEGNKESYRNMAQDVAPIFTDHGALRTVECWGDNIPRGDITDMFGAVAAQDQEQVVFSWVDWESEDACKKAHQGMETDERMQNPPDDMPFDGMRMIYSGFEKLGESGNRGKAEYVQGYVAPVPKDKREAFSNMCATMREISIDCGARHAVDGWSSEIEPGKITDFKRAVKAEADEGIAFGFVEWPSRQAYEQGSVKMREDKRMPGPGSDMPVDGKRMIFGGFEVILDTGGG